MSRTITSLRGFIQKIGNVVPRKDEVLIYRGHWNREDFRLIPSVLRENNTRDAEHAILRELVSSHPNEFNSDRSTLDQLVRVQHYSLPTRLLDVTWNPLVALYFATEGNGVTGEVIVFRVNKTNVKFFDSDTVSCIANLAHLKPDEQAKIDFGIADVDKFNEQDSIDRLLQFIRAEKPHFRAKIVSGDLKRVVCVKPKKNNPRVLAQSGAFLIFGIAEALDDRIVPDIVVERIRINGRSKEAIRLELDRMAINDSTMFPEIEKAAIYIRRHL